MWDHKTDKIQESDYSRHKTKVLTYPGFQIYLEQIYNRT